MIRSTRSSILLCSVAALVAGVGCTDPDREQADTNEGAASKSWFSDATAASGIDFRHDSGARGRHRLPESLGSGCALFDADGDGDLDAYLVSARDLDGGDEIIGAGNRFFRNRGDGTFVDDTAASGLADDGFGCGVATGDVDGDGDLDVYLANLGPDRLFINDGLGRFELADDDRFANDAGFSVAPCFLDYDRDGDLDLFVSRYMDWSLENEVDCTNLQGDPDYCNPDMYGRAIPDRLLRNDGTGRFEDVTESAGLGDAAGMGLAAAAADLDGDGLLDLYVANDKSQNRLWLNRGDGTFAEAAGLRGCATGLDGSPRASMSVSFADLDRDGDFEIHVSNIQGEADGLFENRDGHFLDRAPGWGIAAASRARTRWNGRFLDLDVDGDLDLVVGCGRVLRGVEDHRADRPYAEPDLIFERTSPTRFTSTDAHWPAGLLVEATHGMAWGDLDGDGRDDVLTLSRDGDARVFLRTVPDGTPRPVRIDVRDEQDAPAIGTRLVVTRGDDVQHFQVDTAGGYASAGSHVHALAGPIDSIELRWPDGSTSTWDGPFEPGARVNASPRAIIVIGPDDDPA